MSNSPNGTAVEVKWNPSSSSIFEICFDRDSNSVPPLRSFPLVPDGGFHLIEAVSLRMGSATAECVLAIDGVEVERKPVDFRGLNYALFTLGPVYGAYDWVGTMDYDSVVASPTPVASHLVLRDAGTLTAGQCAALTWEFADSFGGTGGMPFAAAVFLDVDGGEVFADGRCAVAGQALHLPAGATTAEFGVRPGPSGVLEVQAGSTELIGSRDLLPVSAAPAADAGHPPGDQFFPVGCGCGVEATTPALGWALLLARLRLRARAPRSSPARLAVPRR